MVAPELDGACWSLLVIAGVWGGDCCRLVAVEIGAEVVGGWGDGCGGDWGGDCWRLLEVGVMVAVEIGVEIVGGCWRLEI